MKTLIFLGTKIWESYELILSDTKKEEHIERIKELSERENAILKNISFQDLENFKHHIYKKLGLIDFELPFGLKRFISKEEYPYYRLLSKILFLEKSQVLPNTISFQSTEIGLLYNGLLLSNDKNSDTTKRAFQILLNSPIIETEALSNNLQPLEKVYDMSDLEIAYSMTPFLVDAAKMNFKKTYEISVEKIKTGYFLKKMSALIEYLDTTDFLKHPSNFEKTIIQSYISSIFSLLDNDKMEELFFEITNFTNNPSIRDFIVDAFNDSTKLLKFKRKVTFFKPKE